MSGLPNIAVFVFASLTWVAVGCDENAADPIVWGECGPPKLAEPMPNGVYEAIEVGLEPGGILTTFLSDCEDSEEITVDACYLWGKLRENAASTEQTDDFIDFEQSYRCWIACGGQYSASARVMLNDTDWEVGGAGGGGSQAQGWDDLVGPTEPQGCGRAIVFIDEERTFMIATHKTAGPLIYPMDGMVWGGWGEEYEGMQFGDVVFTKDEFLDWCRDYLSQ